MASKPRILLDASALIAGLASPTGGSNVILSLAEAELVAIVVSEQVLAEAERTLHNKLPKAVVEYRRLLAAGSLEIVADPLDAEVAAAAEIIHPKDAPILAAAMACHVDYVVTLDRKHFLDDPHVARRSGLRIGTPGDFLAWFREQLER
ncbi:MAG: putative toxin-antitoxin system toxin component, PIN family [Anaerolineae bacterium]|nr:putative toxin-antitoxin system toxin component, PIN family [Anaerolineae bacterium]